MQQKLRQSSLIGLAPLGRGTPSRCKWRTRCLFWPYMTQGQNVAQQQTLHAEQQLNKPKLQLRNPSDPSSRFSTFLLPPALIGATARGWERTRWCLELDDMVGRSGVRSGGKDKSARVRSAIAIYSRRGLMSIRGEDALGMVRHRLSWDVPRLTRLSCPSHIVYRLF